MTSSGFSPFDAAALCACDALLVYPVLLYFAQFCPKTPKNIPVFIPTTLPPRYQMSTLEKV